MFNMVHSRKKPEVTSSVMDGFFMGRVSKAPSKSVCRRNNKKDLKDRRVLDCSSEGAHVLMPYRWPKPAAHVPNKQCKQALKSLRKLNKIIQQVAFLNSNLCNMQLIFLTCIIFLPGCIISDWINRSASYATLVAHLTLLSSSSLPPPLLLLNCGS